MYKNLIIYLGFNVVVLLLGFAILPLITNTITPSEYGKIGLYFALLVFIQPIIGLSTGSLVQAKKHSLSHIEFERFLTNVYIVSILGFLVIEIILQIYLFIDSAASRMVFFILPIICLSRFFINLRLMEYTIEASPVKFGLSRVGVKFWTFSFLFLFFIIDHSVDSLPYILIIMFSEILVLIFLLKDRITLLFKFEYVCNKYIKEIVFFGLPIAVATIPLWVINEYGKILLTDVSLEVIGLFTFAKQLSLVYILVCASVSNAYAAKVLSITKMKFLMKYFGIYLFIYAFLLIGYFYSYQLISPFVVGGEYTGASSIFKVLLIGSFIQVTTSIPNQLISREGKSKILLISAAIASVIFLFSCHIIFNNITVMNISYSYVIGMSAYSLSMWLFTYLWVLKNAFSN